MRIILGALLTAVVLFVWGFVFWTRLPYARQYMRPLPHGDRLAEALKEDVPETGVYFYPPMPDEDASDAEKEAALEQHRAGPLVQLIYLKQGVDPMDPKALGIGFAQYFVSALLAAMLLAMAAPALPWYLVRVFFVLLLGLFATVAIYGADLVWWHHPADYTLFVASFHASNWLLAGIILGMIVRRRTAP